MGDDTTGGGDDFTGSLTSPTNDDTTPTTDDTTPTTTTDTTDGTTDATGTGATTTETDTDGPAGTTGTTGAADDTAGTTAAAECVEVTVSGDLQFFLAGQNATIPVYAPMELEPAIGAGNLDDQFQVRFFSNATGTFDLASAGVNDNYATCDQCVFLLADFDEGMATTIFFQSEGTLEVDETLPPFNGAADLTFTGVRLVEVTMSGVTTTPVENGQCIELADGTVATLQGWTCNVNFYGDGVECDCGCGLLDPDCGVDPDVEDCDFCDHPGSCSEQACPGAIDTTNTAVCE